MSRTNHLDLIGPRFAGRKGKSTPRVAPDQCDYKIGGTKKAIYVKRKNPKPGERKVAQIFVIDGGRRCESPALISTPEKRRCAEHLSSDY